MTPLTSLAQQHNWEIDMTSPISVDLDKCKKDGLCVADCPMGILFENQDGFPEAVKVADEICIDCGHCVAVCPFEALNQRSMTSAECTPIKKELAITPEQTEQFLRSRRSIRQYKTETVPQEQIQRLIQLACAAPSGHNVQPINWLVFTDPAESKKMAALTIEWMKWMLENKPDMAAILHMDVVVDRWENKGQDRILRNAPHLLVLHAPQKERTAPPAAISAMAYLELAAPSLGLGTCWAGFFNIAAQTFPPLQEALGLPEGHISFAAAMLGYPKAKYFRLPTRKAPEINWR